MFTNAIRATLIALSVAAASATQELSLKVSGPEAVDGVQNLKVKTTITNSGDETLKILNDVRGPLSTMETDTFDISSASGAAPAFTGIKAKYVAESVVAKNKESSFTVLAPGQSVDVDHDLSKAYNLTSSGSGDYTIDARPYFSIVDESGSISEITAKTEAHAATVQGTLAVARTSGLSTRATYRSCSSSEQTALVSAASAAQSYAVSAKNYLTSNTASTTRYVTWFGTYTAARHTTSLNHFTNIAAGTYSSFTYDCTCTEEDTYAYVYPDTYGVIYLCGVFWDVATTGTDSKAGTLIHEASHFTKNGGTQDYVYGQTSAKSLAKSNPANAVMNADNHEYFAENTPAQS